MMQFILRSLLIVMSALTLFVVRSLTAAEHPPLAGDRASASFLSDMTVSFRRHPVRTGARLVIDLDPDENQNVAEDAPAKTRNQS